MFGGSGNLYSVSCCWTYIAPPPPPPPPLIHRHPMCAHTAIQYSLCTWKHTAHIFLRESILHICLADAHVHSSLESFDLWNGLTVTLLCPTMKKSVSSELHCEGCAGRPTADWEIKRRPSIVVYCTKSELSWPPPVIWPLNPWAPVCLSVCLPVCL